MYQYRRRRVYAAVALMLALFLCLDTGVASAKSLSTIKNEIKEKQAELESGQEKEKSLSAQVNSLEEKINELQVSISQNENKLQELKADLEKAQKKVDTQNEDLSARLRNMYKNGSIGFVDVLMESGSFTEFLTNLDMVERIYEGDQEVLDELQKAYDEIDAKKKKVETLQAELKDSKEVAETEMKTVETQKAKIAASNEETEKMLDDLNDEADAITAKIKAEEEARKAAAANSSGGSGSSGGSSGSSSSGSSGGKLSWPCSGTITSEQGWRIHPIFGYMKYHSGMDIGVAYGTPIKAAASGTVIMASWYGGYGYCVIIDHGNGLSTLYGHNSSLHVSYGQKVSRGQTIASAGSTGNSTGPHCHFEVRVNGNVTNPRNYL